MAKTDTILMQNKLLFYILTHRIKYTYMSPYWYKYVIEYISIIQGGCLSLDYSNKTP